MHKRHKKIIVAPEGLKDIGKLQKQYLEELHGRNIKILTQEQASIVNDEESIANSTFLLHSLPPVPQKKEIKISRGKFRPNKRSHR